MKGNAVNESSTYFFGYISREWLNRNGQEY